VDSHTGMTDDQSLVAAVLAGEHGAFTRLVSLHQKLVWHLIQRMVGDVEDTRELSQEVFLRVHRQLPQFRFEAALSTWIGQVAFSVAARQLRRKRLPMVEHDGLFGVDSASDPLAHIDDGSNLEAAHADADLRRHLASSLAALPPLLRTLVTLYHVDELGIPEIARITDLPAGTIKSHLFRARKRLRDRLEPLLGDAT
jgi:RNA polymerase sigma factor (sigma-70 family)